VREMGEAYATTARVELRYHEQADEYFVEIAVKIPKEVRRVFKIDEERTDYVLWFEDEGRWMVVRLFRKY
jgi:hypothetical protein